MIVNEKNLTKVGKMNNRKQWILNKKNKRLRIEKDHEQLLRRT